GIREIVRMVTMASLPQAPEIVEGIINYRGTVIPVLDIRGRFHLPPKTVELTDHLIVAWAGQKLVALRVDRTCDLLQVTQAELESSQASLIPAGYVAGVVKLPEGLVLIHELNTFLTSLEVKAL